MSKRLLAKAWLHDSGGSWLADVTDDAGAPVAEVAHMPGPFIPLNRVVQMLADVEQGLSLVTLRPQWWQVAE